MRSTDATLANGSRPENQRLSPRLIAGLVVLSLASSLALAAGGDRPRPNIILILADDFGYECVTANGGQSYQTPHLDRLAASGIRFESCHVQPLCTPTRVQLMTGRYNLRNYVRFGELPRTEKTFGNLLRDAGYTTAVCGKWQLGHEKDSPKHFGFDEACLWQHTRRPPRYANPGLEYDGVEKDFTNGEYGPALVNEFAIKFISRKHDRPFFLYYPMMLTHSPYQPTPDSPDWNPAAVGENVNVAVNHFAEMTAYMDKLIGQLDARLTRLGIRDNTIVMFVGDNGTGRSVTTRFKDADYPGGKGTTTARGTHVPFIASWPAAIKKPAVNRDPICSTDFLPTICQIAGLPVPADTDGISFLPQLRNESGPRREWLYSWYSPRQRNDLAVTESASDLGYKLYRDGRFFDLGADPFETAPLKTDSLKDPAAAAATRLRAILHRFKDARPADLDRQFSDSARNDSRPEKKRNRNKRRPARTSP